MPILKSVKQGAIAGVFFAAGVAVTVASGKTSYPPVEVLLTTAQSALGQDLVYPTGRPVITAAIVTLQPGESTGEHRHDVPMFAMILDGEITVDYGPDGTKIFKAGDSMVEAFRTYHNGINTGADAVRILAVFAGAENAQNTVMKE